MKKVLCCLTMFLLAGCLATGPEKTLDTLASALTQKDSTLFLAQFDMPRFTAAQVQNITQENPALRTLDSVSKLFGLGAMGDVLGSLVDTQGNITAEFTRGVSTGELALACGESPSPLCPWVPSALRAAKVKELNPKAAVARITTPTNIATWLSLSKVNDTWLIVGQAILEEQAVHYALNTPKSQPQSPATPEKSTPL
ncbi:MAG: hypothetical protein RRY29_02560 [Desulfovibrionaceae bacterium]